MRKLSSAREDKKKQRRNQFLVGGILIFVMLLSTLGYAFNGSDNEVVKELEYGGFKFINQNNYWVLEKDGEIFLLKTKPTDTINLEGIFLQIENYYGQTLYLSSKNKEVNSEIYMNFNQVVTRMQLACEENKTCEEDLPTKTCDFNFIIVEESNKTEIIQKNKCVYIKAPKEDLIRAVDSFLLKILEINN